MIHINQRLNFPLKIRQTQLIYISEFTFRLSISLSTFSYNIQIRRNGKNKQTQLTHTHNHNSKNGPIRGIRVLYTTNIQGKGCTHYYCCIVAVGHMQNTISLCRYIRIMAPNQQRQHIHPDSRTPLGTSRYTRIERTNY